MMKGALTAFNKNIRKLSGIKRFIPDLLFLCGSLVICEGLKLIYYPSFYIFLGCCIMFYAFLSAKRR